MRCTSSRQSARQGRSIPKPQPGGALASSHLPHEDPREEGRLALRIARSILDAAATMAISAFGTRVEVAIDRLPRSAPRDGSGSFVEVEEPWPAPVRVDCRWAGGHAVFSLSVALGRGNLSSTPLIGLRVAHLETDHPILWLNISSVLRDERSFARASVSVTLDESLPGGRKGGIGCAGPGLVSTRRVEVFAILLPEGDVLPLPSDAFARIVHLSLLKLPLAFAPGRPLVHEKLAELLEPCPMPVPQKLAQLYPLPGGVRRYKSTLDTLLSWIAGGVSALDAFQSALLRHYDVKGTTVADTYVRVLEGARLVRKVGACLELTEAGQSYLVDPDPERLFEILHQSYLGLLEMLILTDTEAVRGGARRARLFEGLVGKRYRSLLPIDHRRNWLVSLGLCDRDKDGDKVTPLGRQVISLYGEEVAEIRRRLTDLLEEEQQEALDTFDDHGCFAVLDTHIEEAPTEACAPPISALHAPLPPPPAWSSDRLDLLLCHVRPHVEGLELSEVVLQRIVAALSAGKHLILAGPPGTGKTQIAMALGEAARAEGYCHGLFAATASADATTFETLGGYAMGKDGSLHFRAGIFLAAIEERKWLLVDELNRADVDRAFGELLTVLAGHTVTTAYKLDDGRTVTIGPDARSTHPVPPAFRLIATMNTWDKASLFRLSYALQRRFAVVHIGTPDDAGYARLIADHTSRKGSDPSLDAEATAKLLRLFQQSGILAHRPIGPAIALDMIRYMRRRNASGDGLAEAIAMHLLPQLEGLDTEAAIAVFSLFDEILAPIASPASRAELEARYAELFPHIAFPGA